MLQLPAVVLRFIRRFIEVTLRFCINVWYWKGLVQLYFFRKIPSVLFYKIKRLWYMIKTFRGIFLKEAWHFLERGYQFSYAVIFSCFWNNVTSSMTNEDVAKIPIIQQALILNAVSNGMVHIITSVYLKVTGSHKTQTSWIHSTKLHKKLEGYILLMHHIFWLVYLY